VGSSCFSPNNNNLICTIAKAEQRPEDSGIFIYQLNLSDINVLSYELFHGYNIENAVNIEVMPNKKIFIPTYTLDLEDTSYKFFAVVAQPDAWGKEAGFKYDGFYLQGKNSDAFLPIFPNYHLPALSIGDVAKAHFSAETLRVCMNNRPILGTVHRPNVRYRWSPAEYLDSDTVATPIFTPPAQGFYRYRLTVTGLPGSCWEVEIAFDDIAIFVDDAAAGCVPTGITENKPLKYKGITLYPNPAQDFVTVQYQAEEGVNMTVDIYHISGSKLRSLHWMTSEKGLQTQTLDTQNWVEGAYLFRFRAENGEITIKKVLITK
jgi:hypothetical protein